MQAPGAAEIEIAVADMHIAMADTAVLELDEHLRALRPRRVPLPLLKRLAPFDDVVAQHGIKSKNLVNE